jgi:hypothetical protein
MKAVRRPITARSRLSRNASRVVDSRSPHCRQAVRVNEPWISATSVLPASWWSPSTFWVTTASTSPARSRRATAAWAAPGRARAKAARSSARNDARASGRLMASPSSPSHVPNSSGSNRSQMPPGSRKVGMPDSAEIPAPVKATTPPPRRWAAASSILRALTSGTAR